MPAFLAVTCFAASLLAAASATQVSHTTLATKQRANRTLGFVRSLRYSHRLRVCNAYPRAEALDVFRGDVEKMTAAGPLPYKSCRDFVSLLSAGDKLAFKVGDAHAGIFAVSDLPDHDAILLLVIHRHDTVSTAASFESHVYANLLNAQIAVIDTYKGSAKAALRILDSDQSPNKGESTRSEELQYGSVVAVNAGIYEVDLVGTDGETKDKKELVALNRESYVVLRTGVDAQEGPSFPQEVVVYPLSDIHRLLYKGACVRMQTPAIVLTLMVSVLGYSLQ